MSRIDDLIAEHCPEGVPMRPLGDVGEFIRGNGLQKKDLSDAGVGAIHYGQVFTFYGTTADKTLSFVEPALAARLRRAKPGDLVIASTSENDDDVCKAVAWLGQEEVAVSGDSFIYRHSLDPRYVSYFFQSRSFDTQKRRHISGTKVKRVSGSAMAQILIPVPPLAIQGEIATILGKMELLEAELEAELEARRAQYSHYRFSLLQPSPSGDSHWATLGSVCRGVTTGATPKADYGPYYESGTIPWLRTQEVVWHDIWDTEVRITERAVKETATKWIPENCVIVAISGASAARAAVNKIPMTTNQHCCNLEIDPKLANYRYVFHWLAYKHTELKALGQGARGDLNTGLIKAFPIALPPLAEQARVARVLDVFDALVNDLSSGLPAEIAARRKQYEYYRDRLLTFKELAA